MRYCTQALLQLCQMIRTCKNHEVVLMKSGNFLRLNLIHYLQKILAAFHPVLCKKET